MEKYYFCLDENGNPLMREGDEVNPYRFFTLASAFEFVKNELKNHDGITVVRLEEVETIGAGI